MEAGRLFMCAALKLIRLFYGTGGTHLPANIAADAEYRIDAGFFLFGFGIDFLNFDHPGTAGFSTGAASHTYIGIDSIGRLGIAGYKDTGAFGNENSGAVEARAFF
jgi:hypothetical protein